MLRLLLPGQTWAELVYTHQVTPGRPGQVQLQVEHLVGVPGPGGRQPEELAARALGLGAGLGTDLGCGLWGRLRGVLSGAMLPHA